MTDHPEQKPFQGVYDATLDLRMISWQDSIHGVNKSGKGDYPIGEHRIGIHCKLQRTLLQGDMLVGENPTENLIDLDFTLQLRDARRVFSALERKETSEDEEHTTGFLIYHPPIPPANLTGLSSRVTEESKTGSVTGWALFDEDVLWQISSLITSQSEHEIHVWITVKAAETPKPGLLTYEIHSHRPAIYRWSGKEALVLRDVAMVTTNRAKTASEDSETDEDKPNGILLAIKHAAESINKNIIRMVIFILVIHGAILLELWRLH
jgi:hypothetical protein